MDKTKCKKRLLVFLLFVIFLILVFLGRLAEYIVSEFVVCNHDYNEFRPCQSCSHVMNNNLNNKNIPNHIHQIFLFETSDTLPENLVAAQKTWIRNHPQYTYTLWNKTSINNLLDREYPFLKALYHSYGHWVRRADVARYIVLYHMGGWYVDLDIRSKQSVKPLQEEAESKNKTVILRDTEPWGCSNDFIGITPRHPFLFSVLSSLHKSNRWYIFPYANTMFSTGPMFLWGRYLNYPNKQEFYNINNSSYSKYIEILHSSSWHSWDGRIVWFLFKDPKIFFAMITSLTFLLCLCILYRKLKAS